MGLEEADLAAEIARLTRACEQLVALQKAALSGREDRRLLDRWSAEPMRRVGLELLLEAIPGLAAQFERSVPSEFVAQTDVGVLTVACPCGEAPDVRAGQLTECGCGRWFLGDGRGVRVAFSPEPTAGPS